MVIQISIEETTLYAESSRNGHDLWQHMLTSSKDGSVKLHSLTDAYKSYQHLRTATVSVNIFGQIASSFDTIDRSCESLGICAHHDPENPLFSVSSKGIKEYRSRPKASSMSVSIDEENLVEADENTQFGLESSTLPLSSGTGGSPSTVTGASLERGEELLKEYHRRSKRPTDKIPETKLFITTLIGADSEPSATFNDKRMKGQIFGFNHQEFHFLAENYKLYDESFEDLCNWNAQIASKCRNYPLRQTWIVLKLLYQSNETSSSMSSNHQPHSNNRPTSSTSHASDSKNNNSKNKDHSSKNHINDSKSTKDDNPSKEKYQHTTAQVSSSATMAGDYQHYSSDNNGESISLLEQLDNANPNAIQEFGNLISASADNYNKTNMNHAVTISASADDDDTLMNSTKASPKTTTTMISSIKQRKDSTISTTTTTNGTKNNTFRQIQDVVFQELLEYYCELGDVQSCVSFGIVVSQVTNVEQLIGKLRLQKFSMYYIDLLHRLRIYNVANVLIRRSSDPGISQMNMKSTTMYTNCSQCHQSIEIASISNEANQNQNTTTIICRKCQSILNRCSLCQQTVKGLYVWCSVCSHGGHLRCLTQWFSEHQECPTGCLHRCVAYLKQC